MPPQTPPARVRSGHAAQQHMQQRGRSPPGCACIRASCQNWGQPCSIGAVAVVRADTSSRLVASHPASLQACLSAGWLTRAAPSPTRWCTPTGCPAPPRPPTPACPTAPISSLCGSRAEPRRRRSTLWKPRVRGGAPAAAVGAPLCCCPGHLSRHGAAAAAWHWARSCTAEGPITVWHHLGLCSNVVSWTPLQARLCPPPPPQTHPHLWWRPRPRRCPRRWSLARQTAPPGLLQASPPRPRPSSLAPPRERRLQAPAPRRPGPLKGSPPSRKWRPPPTSSSPRRRRGPARRCPCQRLRPHPQPARSLAGACGPLLAGCGTHCWVAAVTAAATASAEMPAQARAVQAWATRRPRSRQQRSTALAAAGCCRICSPPTAGWRTPCCLIT